MFQLYDAKLSAFINPAGNAPLCCLPVAVTTYCSFQQHGSLSFGFIIHLIQFNLLLQHQFLISSQHFLYNTVYIYIEKYIWIRT